MTREEAATYIKQLWDEYKTNTFGWKMVYAFAVDEAIAALRGPQPDPDTGLVPCGCGGQGLFEGAYLDEEVPSSYRGCLSCAECGMSTAEYEYEQEAMRAWNTAMGWREKE